MKVGRNKTTSNINIPKAIRIVFGSILMLIGIYISIWIFSYVIQVVDGNIQDLKLFPEIVGETISNRVININSQATGTLSIELSYNVCISMLISVLFLLFLILLKLNYSIYNTAIKLLDTDLKKAIEILKKEILKK